MQDSCELIHDILLDYINRNLSEKDNKRVILHITQCKKCLCEVVDLIAIKNEALESMVAVPMEISSAAFDKIIKKEKDLNDILKTNSPFMVFDILKYELEPVKKTIQLALQV